MRWLLPALQVRPFRAKAAASADSLRATSAHRRRHRRRASPSPAARHGSSASARARAEAAWVRACRIQWGVCRSSSVDHRGGVERAGRERRQPEPDRRRHLPFRDPLRQVRHRDLDEVIDHDLHDQCDDAPDQAIQDIGGMCDGADDGQDEAEQAQAERDRRGLIIVADELELIVRGDAGIDQEIRHDRDDRGAKIDQKGRQPGKRLEDHGERSRLVWGELGTIGWSAHRQRPFVPQKQKPRHLRRGPVWEGEPVSSRQNPVRRGCARPCRAARAARSRGPTRSR
jgi:hypothetical protein